MRPKLRSPIPGHNRPRNTHEEPNKCPRHRMRHRTIQSKSRRDIGRHNPKDNPISGSQRQRSIARRLPRRRKYANRVQCSIGGQGQGDPHHNAGHHSPDAPSDSSLRVRSAHDATPAASCQYPSSHALASARRSALNRHGRRCASRRRETNPARSSTFRCFEKPSGSSPTAPPPPSPKPHRSQPRKNRPSRRVSQGRKNRIQAIGNRPFRTNQFLN